MGAERREVDPMDELWRGSEKVVDERKRGARFLLAQRGVEDPPKEQLETVATAMQRHVLEQPDVEEWSTSRLTNQRVALVRLEAAQAVEIQKLQDKEPAPSGSELRARRVGALVNFNHDLAAALGCMSPRIVNRFPYELITYLQGTNAIDKTKETEEQLRGKFRGLRPEVAFDRALQAEMPEGWQFRNASAKEDLSGIDGIVTNEKGEVLNFDFKKANSFNQTIEKLLEQSRITEAQAEEAFAHGFVEVPTKHEGVKLQRCIIDADMLGKINGFDYEDPVVVVEFVEERFAAQQQRKLRTLGKNAIVS
jgi:hypothetical protein